MTVLLSLNAHVGGGLESKRSKKLAERRARNLEAVKKNPQRIPAGLDNRSDILHMGRFLPGPICKCTDVWISARKEMGLSGQEPVAKYDFDGIGVSDRLNHCTQSYFSEIAH